MRRPSAVVVAAVAGLALTAGASAQDVAPRSEDAALPAPGTAILGAAPLFQSWHREFAGGGEVPMARDLEGPLLDQLFPGPRPVVEDVNADADALGFAPLAEEEADVGDLVAGDVHAEIRSVAFTLEVGVLDRLSADVMVPVVRTEVEPSLSLDASGASLGGAAGALDAPTTLFGSIADARDELASRVESGELSAEREDEARDLLEASGAFASALRDRVERNALVPLAGTRAGSEVEAFYAGLRSGFQSFGLGLPSLGLASEGNPGFLTDFFLGTLAAEDPGTSVRGWLAGEAEFGLRFALLRRWERDEGVRLRTTLGARVRLPFRDANAVAFVNPTSLLGEPLGDGQRDVEVSLYQDVGLGGWLDAGATVRYGVQAADDPTVAVRSPGRPLALPGQRVEVERDLGDYLRARVSPRVHLNPSLSVGLEYRYWHKGADRFRGAGGVDASALELRSEETRHRLGLGASYRPAAPGDDASPRTVPELGVAFQTPVAGSGGETPAAGLATFHVRVPVRPF